MRQVIVGCVLVIVIVAYIGTGQGQSTRCRNPVAQRELKEVKQQPNLGVPYVDVAKFKIASRKTTYRRGEMINIDIAMLNISSSPAFFRKLLGNTLTFSISNQKDDGVTIIPRLLVLEGTGTQSFNLLNRNLQHWDTMQPSVF